MFLFLSIPFMLIKVVDVHANKILNFSMYAILDATSLSKQSVSYVNICDRNRIIKLKLML